MKRNESDDGWDDLVETFTDLGEDINTLIREQTAGMDDPIGLNILAEDIRFIDTNQQKEIEFEEAALKKNVLETRGDNEIDVSYENEQKLIHSGTDVLLECLYKETKEE